MEHRLEIYDTTLRDGTQGEHISLSVEDKCRISEHLDDLGFDFIEGGWPGSNPRDVEFFERARTLKLKTARIAAFGSTRRKAFCCDDDPNVQALLKAETPVVTIFGKSWPFHVTDALRLSLSENLDIIADTVSYLAARVPFLVYDAEHFFDGYKADPEYALATILAAAEAGAARIVLCDTNGGSLPNDITVATRAASGHVSVPLGIHCHNDGELAVANTLAGVSAGAIQIQGTINGYGERCGNVNLCAAIPNLELKLGVRVLPDGQLKKLRETARFVSDLVNLPLDPRAGERDVDRPSVVLQLRQFPAREDVRPRISQEGAAGAHAAGALLVPLGRRLHLGDRHPPALGGLLGRQRDGRRQDEQLRIRRHRAAPGAGRVRHLRRDLEGDEERDHRGDHLPGVVRGVPLHLPPLHGRARGLHLRRRNVGHHHGRQRLDADLAQPAEDHRGREGDRSGARSLGPSAGGPAEQAQHVHVDPADLLHGVQSLPDRVRQRLRLGGRDRLPGRRLGNLEVPLQQVGDAGAGKILGRRCRA